MQQINFKLKIDSNKKYNTYIFKYTKILLTDKSLFIFSESFAEYENQIYKMKRIDSIE